MDFLIPIHTLLIISFSDLKKKIIQPIFWGVQKSLGTIFQKFLV